MVDLLENKINIFEENSEINFLESKTLSEVLHKKGINMKFLARLFTTFSFPFLKMMALKSVL